MDERAEMLLLRQLERRVVAVEPLHQQLQRTPRVEAQSARIGIDKLFNLAADSSKSGHCG